MSKLIFVSTRPSKINNVPQNSHDENQFENAVSMKNYRTHHRILASFSPCTSPIDISLQEKKSVVKTIMIGS